VLQEITKSLTKRKKVTSAKEFEMSRSKQFYALVSAVILITPLAACAVYGRCGTAGCPGDAKITNDVRMRMDQYPPIEAPNSVSVQTMDHVVYLNGEVSTSLQRSTAESVARAVPGVTRVVNSISVDHGGG
jgi:hyperosmotically inducible periplasmic protein